MDPFTVILLASQLYMSVPHTAPPEHWPTLEVTITESSQIFPDACNRSGATSWSRYIGIGTVACANTNLLTRRCNVTYSTNPLASVFVVGLPFANRMLLNHELEHCLGGDHPVPGTLSLAEATKIWHDLGQPYATPAEWAEIEAMAERAGGLGSAEVEAEIARQMPKWVEAGKQYAAELALRGSAKPPTAAVDLDQFKEAAEPPGGRTAGLDSAEMQSAIAQPTPGRVASETQEGGAEPLSPVAAQSEPPGAGASELVEATALIDL